MTDRERMAQIDRLVTVCSHCLEQSCWEGRAFCAHYKTAAGLMLLPEELGDIKERRQ